MRNAKLLIIQHVSFEKPGVIPDWARFNNIDYQVFHIYRNEPLPSPDDFDYLVMMGGPMSVNDHIEYPWIEKEMTLIRQCLVSQVPVIGICLGSQMLAKALGANVYQSTQKEIGWYPVHFETQHLPAGMKVQPISIDVFHWHGETFDLPDECVRLASSELTPNQFFLYKDLAMGIQFHAEVKAENVQELTSLCADELNENGSHIMDKQAILRADIDYGSINQMMYNWLNFLFRRY